MPRLHAYISTYSAANRLSFTLKHMCMYVCMYVCIILYEVRNEVFIHFPPARQGCQMAYYQIEIPDFGQF
jgi:hypothetical protein